MAIKRITTNLIKDSDIATVDIANNAITAAKITDGNITTAKLADLGVTAGKLAGTLDLTGKTITVATATTGDSDTSPASTAFVQQEIAALVDSSPSSLNTLNELAAALGDDASFSTTVTNSIATKLPLAGGTLTGSLAITGTSLVSDDQTNDWVKQSVSGTTSTLTFGNTESTAGQAKWEYTRSNGRFKGYIGANAVTNFMSIESSGNVGIGTTNPAQKLHVAGGQARFDDHISIQPTKKLFLDGGNDTYIDEVVANTIAFHNGGAERMRIALGNVGIGDTSPSSITSSVSTLSLNGTDAGTSGGLAYKVNGTDKGYHYVSSNFLLHQAVSGVGHRFLANNTEAARIDTSGNLLVGTTALTPGNGNTDTGHLLKNDGRLFASSASNSQFNRNSDGDIVTFRQSGNLVGSIKADAGSIGIGSGDCGLLFYDAGNRIIPRNGTGTSDASLDLGYGTDRFKDLYLSGDANVGGVLELNSNNSGFPTSGMVLNQNNFVYLRGGSNGLIMGKAGDNEAMRIDSSGRVGIGTASPQTSTKGLHVVHDANEGTPSFPSGEVIIAQRNFNSSQGCHIGIIGGSAGDSAINFGDKDNSDAGIIRYHHNGDFLGFTTNTTEHWKMLANGSFQPTQQHTKDIGGVNAEVRNIYAQGLYVGGSAAANKLDDYEEGTWTPTVSGGTPGYQVRTGYYTKIGNIVRLRCSIKLNAWSGSATVSITGLPFSSIATAYNHDWGAAHMENKPNASVWVVGATGSSVFFRRQDAASADTPLAHTDIDANTGIMFTVVYQTAA